MRNEDDLLNTNLREYLWHFKIKQNNIGEENIGKRFIVIFCFSLGHLLITKVVILNSSHFVNSTDSSKKKNTKTKKY